MITLETNYSKKLGLPGYSSHQFSITLRTELAELSQVKAESNRLYQLLQQSVDNSIRETGYLPESNGNHTPKPTNGNGSSDVWQCSDKQKALILKVVEENLLDKNEVEAMAKDLFDTPVRMLNKLQASNFIDLLLKKHGGKQNGGRRGRLAGVAK